MVDRDMPDHGSVWTPGPPVSRQSPTAVSHHSAATTAHLPRRTFKPSSAWCALVLIARSIACSSRACFCCACPHTVSYDSPPIVSLPTPHRNPALTQSAIRFSNRCFCRGVTSHLRSPNKLLKPLLMHATPATRNPDMRRSSAGPAIRTPGPVDAMQSVGPLVRWPDTVCPVGPLSPAGTTVNITPACRARPHRLIAIIAARRAPLPVLDAAGPLVRYAMADCAGTATRRLAPPDSRISIECQPHGMTCCRVRCATWELTWRYRPR